GTWPSGVAMAVSLLLRLAAALWIAAFFITLAGGRLTPSRDESPWGHIALLFVSLNAVLFLPADWVSAHVRGIALAVGIIAVLLTWLVETYQILGDFLGLRRVYAIAQLCVKEAVRRKVLWVFFALLLIVLFASWFIPGKAEDQLRTYVTVVFLA